MRAIALVSLLAACDAQENLGFSDGASALGATRWTVALGGTNREWARAVATDSLGDVIATGITWSTSVDYGTGPVGVPRTTDHHAFVTKRVASDGAERWTIPLYASAPGSMIETFDLAVTPDDGIVVAGQYGGTVEIGGGTPSLPVPDPPDRVDSFVAKYARDGALIWAKPLGANGQLGAVIADAPGNIYVTGAADGATYVMALAADGTHLWTRVFACGGAATSLAVATNGDVLVAGEFGGSCSFGGAMHDAQAGTRVFVTRFRNDGLYMSSAVFGPTGDGRWSAGGQLAVATSGVVLVGYSAWTLSDLGTSIVTAIDDTTSSLWSVALPNATGAAPPWRGVVALPDDQLVATAWNDLPYSADHPERNAGKMEVATFNTIGAHALDHFGAMQAGTASFRDSAAATTGAVAFVGSLTGTADLGSGPVPTHGDSDMILVYVDPAN